MAETVAAAKLIVQNGVGYDTYMNKIESASENGSRQVIDVQKLLGLPESTPNPHLWYKPTTMPAVASALVAALSKLAPDHAAYFQANAARFDQSLQTWYAAIAHSRPATRTLRLPRQSRWSTTCWKRPGRGTKRRLRCRLTS